MSIHESIHHYNVGTLITIPTDKLKVALLVLENKIAFMYDVARQASVCAEVMQDMRKYEVVRSEIARLIEARENAIKFVNTYFPKYSETTKALMFGI
jgi:hypothetical protein